MDQAATPGSVVNVCLAAGFGICRAHIRRHSGLLGLRSLAAAVAASCCYRYYWTSSPRPKRSCHCCCCFGLHLGLRVPGHAILKCVFPLALGFALVPRGFAGSVMGSAALAATYALVLWAVARRAIVLVWRDLAGTRMGT